MPANNARYGGERLAPLPIPQSLFITPKSKQDKPKSHPPQTILGMNRNFELKHPRSADGKFAEKNRKEPGLTLSAEDSTWPKEYMEGDIDIIQWADKPFNDIAPDERYLLKERYLGFWTVEKIFKTARGYEIDTYTQNPMKLSKREYLDKDRIQITNVNRPCVQTWHKNGEIHTQLYKPSRQGIEEFFATHNTTPDVKVILLSANREDGSLDYESFYHKLDAPLESGEQIVGEEIYYHSNGNPAEIRRFNLDGKSCGDRNYPMGEKFDENGNRTLVAFLEAGTFIRHVEG